MSTQGKNPMATLWKRFLLKNKTTFYVWRFSHLQNAVSPVNNAATTVFPNQELSEGSIFENIDEPSTADVKTSVLENSTALQDISYVGPPLDFRSFNFAAFANDSIVIQKLADLGVNFYKIELGRKFPTYLLQLDFEKDVIPYITFLRDKDVPVEQMGRFFTKNPFFFEHNLDDLQVRINYLESKRFTRPMISKIICANPFWLNFSTTEIDSRLGFFQYTFKLSGSEVRHVAFKSPSLITRNSNHIRNLLFEIKEVIGFSQKECKNILLKQPYAWTLNPEALKKRLEFMVVEMELPLSVIARNPSGLVNRDSRIRSRHLFLKSLGRAQYNPEKPNYISIRMITHGDDATFCQRVAKATLKTFNEFLKTL